MLEREENNPYLSGKGMMDSVKSPEEEVKFNTLVNAPHIPSLVATCIKYGCQDHPGK